MPTQANTLKEMLPQEFPHFVIGQIDATHNARNFKRAVRGFKIVKKGLAGNVNSWWGSWKLFWNSMDYNSRCTWQACRCNHAELCKLSPDFL
jgi:hypothetical protein